MLFGIGCIACWALPVVATGGVVAGAGNLIAGGPAVATLLLATAAVAVTAFAWRRRATRRGRDDPEIAARLDQLVALERS